MAAPEMAYVPCLPALGAAPVAVRHGAPRIRGGKVLLMLRNITLYQAFG
ncbi:hypothetical protein MesoLjLc_48180 [Mesorhizobium sp. L-8-10]|nr:hypothetical protein [Mesorhizobium sp. L-8-10]BCH32888.1 hypothetical protein MesoLjLc_48180 [Mesorhizobium sp. L-8-10]